ncbi:MAG: cytochrome c [Telluria sp.]|jgi:cytochrome c553|uniref:c-type cytochrome n=1 Tax=Massilia sp. TWR1-2-2 TaxID=2804584 RepID=UPI00346A0C0E
MKKIFALLVLAGSVNAAVAADIVGNPKAGAAKVEMCIGCHGIPGYKATFPEVFRVPMIGGQSAKYIENALQGYKKGERKHPSMRGIAQSLSDQDIADVAAYYAQQPSNTAQK